MAVLIEYLPRQSNRANWAFSDQLCDTSNDPLWTTVPGDLVVTLVVVDRSGIQQLTVSSTDGSSQLITSTNGMIDVNVTPEQMGALSAGIYDVWLKIVTGNFTIERNYARLPVCEGI